MKRYIFYFVFVLQATCLTAQTQIQTVQYWFDGNFAGQTTENVTPATVTAILTHLQLPSVLSEGIHIAHIRAKDNNGYWSVVHSQMFYKLSAYSANKEVASYEYWWDSDFSSRQIVAAAGATVVINQPLNTQSAENGLHILHIRAKDNAGQYSTVHSQLFYKNLTSATENKIASYRFWYDDDFDNQHYINLTTASNPYELNDNMIVPQIFGANEEHIIHFQFQDLLGQWSAVTTDTFKIAGEDVITTITRTDNSSPFPKIVGYYNILGQKIFRKPDSGLYIILYDDGKAEKILK